MSDIIEFVQKVDTQSTPKHTMRVVPTSQTEGVITLRYAPRAPLPSEEPTTSMLERKP